MRNDYQIRPRFYKGSKGPVGKEKKDKRTHSGEFESRFIPNKMGGMDEVKVPKKLSLEEKIVKKIRERSKKEEKK